MSGKFRKQRGFTMTELLTALTIAGISLSVAVPSFTAVVNNNRRATGINQFVSTMHIARSEAITRHARVRICPSSNGTSCQAVSWNKGWLAFVDLNNDQTIDAGEQVLVDVGELSKIDISTTEFPGFLIYRPSGRIMVATTAANSGELTFCDPRGASHARVIIIDSSGYPRLSKTTDTGATPTC
jgi:type IV fimbrial biogenesis protein FimT